MGQMQDQPNPTAITGGGGSPSMSPGDPTQGPAGVGQGFNGANVASAAGAPLGMQRDQMGGMGPGGPPGAPDPIGQLIAEVVQAFMSLMSGGGAGAPGGAAPPPSPMPGPPK